MHMYLFFLSLCDILSHVKQLGECACLKAGLPLPKRFV